MFRLMSLNGSVIDEILSVTGHDKESALFTKVNVPNMAAPGDGTFTLAHENQENSLIVQTDNLIYKKTSQNLKSAVSLDSALSNFESIWKAVDKILKFPEVRRVGIVAEFQIEPKDSPASTALISKLTHLSAPANSGRAMLMYDDMRLTNGERRDINVEVDDFENSIRTFYLSEMDETPSEGFVNATIDYQRYYNPAPPDGLRAVKSLKDKFAAQKHEFRTILEDLGV